MPHCAASCRSSLSGFLVFLRDLESWSEIVRRLKIHHRFPTAMSYDPCIYPRVFHDHICNDIFISFEILLFNSLEIYNFFTDY